MDAVDTKSPLLGNLKQDDPFYELLLKMSATVRAPEATPFWPGVARSLATNVPWLIAEIRRLHGLVGERPPAPKVLVEAWGVLDSAGELISDRYELGYDDAPLLFSNEGDAKNEAEEKEKVVRVQVVQVGEVSK